MTTTSNYNFDKTIDLCAIGAKDGFNLISNDFLHQICSNKDNISLLEQYIRELQAQNAGLKEYIDTELSNKADIPKLTLSGTCNFYVTKFGSDEGGDGSEGTP